MKFLITIIGPTAIGKTSLSIALAKRFGCEILSADSRQFFREMRIGTAVPEAHELAAATHHFIQHKSINDTYTVGHFERDALAVLDMLFEKKDLAVMVGGSGLYVDAVLKGFDEFPDVPAAVRDHVREGYESQGIEWLQNQLQVADPGYYTTVNLLNPQRLMRAVEVCLASGTPYSSFLSDKKKARNFIPIIIGLDAPRPVIYDRINRRVDIMVAAGLVEEAQGLYRFKELNALQTVGYKELFNYFDGHGTLAFAIEEIKKNTRRFAKRQLTWFRRNENTIWFDYATDYGIICDEIERTMQNHLQISDN